MDVSEGGLPKFARQLRVLGYVPREPFDVYSSVSVRELTVWLEEHCFEYLDEREQQRLRANDEQWLETTFTWYVQLLGCPFQFATSSSMSDLQRATTVEWMLNYALGLRYQSNAAQFNAAAASRVQRVRVEQLKQHVTVDTRAPRFVAAVRELAASAGLPRDFEDSDAADVLLACAREGVRLLRKEAVMDVEEDEEVEKDGKDEKQQQQQQDAAVQPISESFPLGFDTGDKDLNDAARVLRLLYSEDLRGLQSRINELLVRVQTITFDPQVDAALGQVGR